MNEHIRYILNQISTLEDELRAAFIEQEAKMLYRIEGKRVKFERAIKEAHQRLKLGTFRWFLTVPPLNYLTAPIIYGLIIPLVFLDITVTVYQLTCFPIYKISKVRRSQFIVFDHQHLSYLNAIEKFHCLYCSYANGFIAYAGEIIARTEQYFCPIKHASKLLHSHSRYAQFLDYGDATEFQSKLNQFRTELANERKNNIKNTAS